MSNLHSNALIILHSCSHYKSFHVSDWGYIKVATANYGQTDHTTCSTGRSLDQLSNVDCFQETSVRMMSIIETSVHPVPASLKVKMTVLYDTVDTTVILLKCFVCDHRCDGRKSCSVPAVNCFLTLVLGLTNTWMCPTCVSH